MPLPLHIPPPYRSSSRLALLSNAFCSSALRGRLFLWVPAPSSKRETAFVIEYSIGEPFNKSGNGIRLRINVLCRGKRSHHHFNVQAVLKEHLACHLSRPWEQNDTDVFLLCTLCECSSPNILYGYVAYFPHPSPSTSAWSRWRDTSSTTEGYCHEKPLRRFGWQPYFSPSACRPWVVGALMIFPGQAEVGVQVYVCVSVDGKIGRHKRYEGNVASLLNIFPDSSLFSLFVWWTARKPYLCGEARGCLSPRWRERDRGSTFLALSVSVGWWRVHRRPHRVWGVFLQQTEEEKENGKNVLPRTAHPSHTRDVPLNGSVREISRSTA